MYKVSKCKDCCAGKHCFVVSEWRSGTNWKRANSYTCQHCLAIVEGDNVVKQTRAELHPIQDSEATPDGANAKNS